MLVQMTAIFGDGWWDYMMVGVSNWHFDSASVNKRTRDCEVNGENSNYCKNEAWVTAELRLQLYDKLILTRNIPIIFIDSFSQSGKQIGMMNNNKSYGKMQQIREGFNRYGHKKDNRGTVFS